jgi:hypothetical protein
MAYEFDDRCSTPGRGKRFLSAPQRPDRLQGPPSRSSTGYRGYTGVKWPGRGQEWWNYTSTPPYVFMEWCLIKDRNNFSFITCIRLRYYIIKHTCDDQSMRTNTYIYLFASGLLNDALSSDYITSNSDDEKFHFIPSSGLGKFNPLKSIRTTSFNIIKPRLLPTQCMCVFHMVLTMNSICFPHTALTGWSL